MLEFLNMFQQKPEVYWPVAIFFTFVLLLLCRRLPTISSTKEFVGLLDSRGGNIAILSLFSLWSAVQSYRFIYYAIQVVETGKITPDNAILGIGLTFSTGMVTGGFIGALLKTMTGEHSTAFVADLEPLKPLDKVNNNTNANVIPVVDTTTKP